MAEVSARRVLVIAALAGAVVGGAVAGGVAQASGNNGGSDPSASGGGRLATARVVRTNLESTVQIGGSIAYRGSYVIAAATGATPQQMAQAEQQLEQAQQTLAADRTAAADSTSSDTAAVAQAQSAVDTATSTLATDEAQQRTDCAGAGASSPACVQDTQKVSADNAQLTQARQQLSTAQLAAVRDRDQSQAKVQADSSQVHAAATNLSLLRTTAVGSGTTFTSLPKAGDIVRENQPVYALNGEPVPLLYGSVAAYRAFFAGMSDGADVGELTRDLIAMGYGAGLTASNHYSSATAAAVARWQAAIGVPATGTVLLGQVVFEPGPIRVTSVTPSVGQAVGPGTTVLDATSTTPIVTVALDVTQEYLVKPGAAVSVVLPDGSSTVPGHVRSVGNVATCPNGNGSGAGNGSPDSADQSPCASGGDGNSSTPTVAVTITLDRTPTGARLDQAPVNVNITTQRADNVLAVPVNALLALQGGGAAVEVVTGGRRELVAVTTGLYSNTMVEIRGSGIRAGTRVEVPAS